MKSRKALRWTSGIFALVFIMSLSGSRLPAQEAQEEAAAEYEWVQPELPETFTAWAIVMGIHATGSNTRVLIRIDRWSTPEEREKILSSIIELGEGRNRRDLAQKQASLLQSMEETGFIRDTSAGVSSRNRFPSERLRYAWQWRVEGTGKRRIVLALDRPIGFAELRQSSRTLDYGMSIIVLDVDENGEGSGLLSLGTMVTFDQDTERLTLENFSSEPIRLNNVRKSS